MQSLASGTASMPLMSFHWPMKIIGSSTTTVNGSLSHQRLEETSTLYRLDYCLELIFISYLIAISFQSILMYVWALTSL